MSICKHCGRRLTFSLYITDRPIHVHSRRVVCDTGGTLAEEDEA